MNQDPRIDTMDSSLFGKKSNSELASLFECPVCFEYILPPILQCQNGHLVCQACRKMITTCPTCRIQITSNIRNLQMEKVASSVFFPCKYSILGCKNQLLYQDKPGHEEVCGHKPYICPCPGRQLLVKVWFNVQSIDFVFRNQL